MSTFGMTPAQMATYTDYREGDFEYSHTEESGAVIMEKHQHIYDAKLLIARIAINQDGSTNQLELK